MGPYELLGVEPGATELDVRRAHRELVRLLHPDAQPHQLRGRADRHLQLVDEARQQVLADIRRRERGVGPVVPTQRRPDSDPGAPQRWADHQDWLNHRQVSAEEPASGDDRSRRRRRALFLAPFVLGVTLQLVLAVGLLLGSGR